MWKLFLKVSFYKSFFFFFSSGKSYLQVLSLTLRKDSPLTYTIEIWYSPNLHTVCVSFVHNYCIICFPYFIFKYFQFCSAFCVSM